MPPHPLLADDPPASQSWNWLSIASGTLFGFAVLLFAGGIVFTALNGFSVEESWGDSVTSYFFPLVPLTFSAIGLLIARRESSNPIGWICLLIGIAGLGPLFPAGYARYALITHPGALPLGQVSAWMEEWGWLTWAAAAGIFFVLLFPDGKLLSHRWKPAMWLGGIATVMSFAAIAFKPGRMEFNPSVVNPFGLPDAGSLFDMASAGIILLVVAVLVAATSLILRFVRSEGDLRLQLKWLISAGSAVIMSHIASTVSTVGYAAALGPAPLQPAASSSTVTIVQGIATLTWISVPLCAGVAVLKFRLDRIDAAIRNVVAVLVLAAVEVATFAISVLALTLLLTPGVRPNLAASLGGGAIAAGLAVPAWKLARMISNRAVFGSDRVAPETAIG